MQRWIFLLVLCSCTIVSSVANNDPEDQQNCSDGGVCVPGALCPNGVYNETYAQIKNIVTLRIPDDITVCRKGEKCCKNENTVRTNVNCLEGICVRNELCPNGVYNETYAQIKNIISLRAAEDSNVCQSGEICCKNEQIVRTNMMSEDNESAIEYGCGVSNPDGIGNQFAVNDQYATNNTMQYAKYGQYPWVVLILQQESFVGAGTLIHPWFVLTAAHIVQPKDNLIARFGAWDLNREENVLPNQNIDIQAIIVHPEYNSVGLHNDIAMAQLKQTVRYDRHIRPICLPSSTDLFDGEQCTATGWGKDRSEHYGDVLKRVNLPVIERKRCKQLFAATLLGPFFRLHKSVLCAGAMKDADMCFGDGGSGLFCPMASGSYVLAGIVSWGMNCHQEHVPGAYVNVAKFVSWINATIDDHL